MHTNGRFTMSRGALKELMNAPPDLFQRMLDGMPLTEKQFVHGKITSRVEILGEKKIG
jgi:hypothetical protein